MNNGNTASNEGGLSLEEKREYSAEMRKLFEDGSNNHTIRDCLATFSVALAHLGKLQDMLKTEHEYASSLSLIEICFLIVTGEYLIRREEQELEPGIKSTDEEGKNYKLVGNEIRPE